MPHVRVLIQLDETDPLSVVDREPTIHDLFNELHRRLPEMGTGDIELSMIADKLDTLHHDYTDLVDGDSSDRQPPSVMARYDHEPTGSGAFYPEDNLPS